MASPNTYSGDWKRRLLEELKRDKKRTVLLAILVLVAIIVVGRQVVKAFGPVRAEAAGTTAVAGRPAAPAAVKRAAPADPASPAPAGPVARRTVSRDIFTPGLELFPPDQTQAGKASVTTAPAVDEQAIKVKQITSQAQALALQSTVVCDVPTAIINGKVLKVGQELAGFEIVGIEARSCEVQKEGVRITLSMKE